MAIVEPRKFCGAARKFEEGGSLTIIASVLVDTESRSDTYIYEEFKGTANMEIHMDRTLLELRIFPAINIEKSKTRREELLLEPDVLNKVWVLRKLTSQMSMAESMELLIQQFEKKQRPTRNSLIICLKGQHDPARSEYNLLETASRLYI